MYYDHQYTAIYSATYDSTDWINTTGSYTFVIN